MKTRYNKLLLAFLFLILAICAAGGCGPPENGPYVEYYDDGKKELEAHFKDGKRDGPLTDWYENGQKSEEGHFKDGKLVSVAVWKPNGEPCPITKIVDGSGILVEYYENGKKKLEAQFKNGKPISQKVF